jgi:hypothetical protein
METDIKQLRCGACGEKMHELYLRPTGEIITECIKCHSQSIIFIYNEPKIVIKNNSGDGTLCVF